MSSIILNFILSIVCVIVLSNFIYLANKKGGNDFTVKEYFNKFNIKHTELQYVIVFVIIFQILSNFNPLSKMLIYYPLTFALILAFIMDIKYMIIPDTSNIIILASGVINIIFNFSKEAVLSSILGFLVGGLFFYIVNIVFAKLTGKVGFGFGDIKILATVGLLFGLKTIVVIMIMSIIISALFSIAFLIYNKIIKRKEEYLPFGPFIVISTIIVCIIPATTIVQTYFNLVDKIIEKIGG